MPMFGSGTSLLEQEIEKATQDTVVREDVPAMYEICDRINSTPEGTKEAYRCLVKRMQNSNPRVALLALTLLDICVMNCGKKFHLEICSRDFLNHCKSLLAKAHPKVQDKLKFLLNKWSNNEFKADPQLAMIDNFIQRSKMDGVSFDISEQSLEASNPKLQQKTQRQEDDDIAKAIELSLQESKKKEEPTTVTSGPGNLYPSVNKLISNTKTNITGNSTPAVPSGGCAIKSREPRKVRALYDFEAAEENELSFKAGEIIIVLEDRDANWWKGSNHRGEGLFPSNFVSSDLDVQPTGQLSEPSEAANEAPTLVHITQIDEAKMDSLLQMLHDADPAALQRSENDLRMEALEAECALMNPLIDAELEKIDRKHASLSSLSRRLTDALTMYHNLLRQPHLPFPASTGISQQPALNAPQMPFYVPMGQQPGSASNPAYTGPIVAPGVAAQHAMPTVIGVLPGQPLSQPHPGMSTAFPHLSEPAHMVMQVYNYHSPQPNSNGSVMHNGVPLQTSPNLGVPNTTQVSPGQAN